MPTYVYECKKCEKTFEIEQRITEQPLTDCGCGEEGSLKRVIQRIAVMFKGSGFHINDYKSSGSGAPTKSEPEADTAAKPAEACGPSCGCHPAKPSN